MSCLTIVTNSPQETWEVGKQLGAVLEGGFFVALQGELGGGKTCFTRGIVAAVSPGSAHMVASPTFAIMNEYPGTTPVYHFDFYRLTSPYEIVELGFEDYFAGEGICIAEWSERLMDLLPPDHLTVLFEHAGDDRRRITLESSGSRSGSVLEKLAKSETG